MEKALPFRKGLVSVQIYFTATLIVTEAVPAA